MLATTAPGNWRSMFRTKRPGLQIVRAFAPLIIGGTMVIGVRYLPLAEATVILFAGPFIVVALSGKLLGEKVGRASWIGVAIGFLAVLIVARPGFGALSVYSVFPLAGAFFYAAFQLLTRQLAAAGEDPTTTLAWTVTIGLIVTAPLAFIMWQPVSTQAWIVFFAMSLVFGASQLLLARAFTYAPANVLSPFSYVQIIAATAFGYIAFGDVPDVWTIIGIVMIIGAGVYIMRSAK
jgi:drug/metabolite transporter (DMT)-like permease